LLLCLFTAITTCNASETTRPKIGLVLSGGGARGFAHVGVLRWFEEHHIPVDKIAGTSMGGLVGGLYATGMTSAELQQLINHINWSDLFRPLPAYETLSFRRKEDRLLFPNSFELGMKGGVKFPPGVNPGHAIGLLLDRYTYQYSTIKSFDELPIPFRCIATDMVEARQVVLASGSFSTALQATMAIPGVFYPVDIDGKIYASDGGLLNNVPTDVAEQMGADLIIAINIGTPLGKRETLDSLGGVLGQTVSVAMEENIRKNLDTQLHPKLKVVIAPDLKQYTTYSFEDSKAIEDLGYQGAEENAADLLPLALNEQDWEAYVQDKSSRIREKDPSFTPQVVNVRGTDENSAKAIQKSLQNQIGRPLNIDLLEKDLNILWGRGRYAGLSYELSNSGDQNGLLIHARPKTYAPPFLNIGLEINNTQTDVFDFNLRGRITFMDLRQQGSEWRLDASLGSEISAGVEYYKLLGSSHFFVSPTARYDRTKSGVFSEGEELGQYSLATALFGADIGYDLGSSSEIRLGYDFGHRQGKIQIGTPDLPEGGGKFSRASLRWAYDSTDSAILPTRGLRIASRMDWNFDIPLSDEKLPQASVRAVQFIPLGDKDTLFAIGEGDTSFDKSPTALNQFRLGGLLRISAATRNEFLGNHLVYGGFGYLRTLAHLPLLLGEKLSAGAWYEVGSAYNDWSSKEIHHSVTAAIIAETFLGPIFVGASFGDDGRNNFLFAIGKIF